MRIPELVLPGRTPMRLDASVAVGASSCALDVVGPGCGSWKGWVVGSSGFGYDQHLVITASPMPLRNYAKVVNGPAWYPRAVWFHNVHGIPTTLSLDVALARWIELVPP